MAFCPASIVTNYEKPTNRDFKCSYCATYTKSKYICSNCGAPKGIEI